MDAAATAEVDAPYQWPLPLLPAPPKERGYFANEGTGLNKVYFNTPLHLYTHLITAGAKRLPRCTEGVSWQARLFLEQ